MCVYVFQKERERETEREERARAHVAARSESVGVQRGVCLFYVRSAAPLVRMGTCLISGTGVAQNFHLHHPAIPPSNPPPHPSRLETSV